MGDKSSLNHDINSSMETRKKYRRHQRLKFYGLLASVLVLILLLIGVIALKIGHNQMGQQLTDALDQETMQNKQKLNVPLENQWPDLPNGCEVTALSMLLNYYHIDVNKDQLAQKIKHVPVKNPDGTRGNPHLGFVGSMSEASGGWCVYNEPLYAVARKYTKRISNATGQDFIALLYLVAKGHPVMIITTLSFSRVQDMQTWQTEEGPVKVTPSSHACVITGYDKARKVVYVNDPYGHKNKAVSWANLQASYDQQGRQALYMK